MADAASLPKTAVLPKTIILNSPIHYDEEKSVVFSRKDSGKSKIINLSNSKEMEFKHMDEIKTEENLETSNGFHWLLNSIKNRLHTLLRKKPNKKVDWRRDEEIALENSIENLNRCFLPLHKDFKHFKGLQSFFLIFDLFRQTLFSLLVILTFDSPFSGLILVNVINVGYIVCYLAIRPFKETVDLIQNLLNEICLLISCLCALIMAAMEKSNTVELETKMILGWIMVFVNTFLILMFLLRIVCNFIPMIYLLLKLIITVIIKKLRKKEKVGVAE